MGEHDISTEEDCETIYGSTTYCAPPVQDFNIAKVIPHSGYVGTKRGSAVALQNDIALIRIDGKINLKAGTFGISVRILLFTNWMQGPKTLYMLHTFSGINRGD